MVVKGFAAVVAGMFGSLCGADSATERVWLPLEDVRIGDEAVIFGMQETAELSVEEVSALANSFNYEMICAAGKRVPRIYYENGQPVEKVDYI